MTKIILALDKKATKETEPKGIVDFWALPFPLAQKSLPEALNQAHHGRKQNINFRYIFAPCDREQGAPIQKMGKLAYIMLPLSDTKLKQEQNISFLQTACLSIPKIAYLKLQENWVIEAKKIPELFSGLAKNFHAIIVEPSHSEQRIFEMLPIEEIAPLISNAHQNGLKIGFGGKIEAPDIVRLLAFAPDYLYFSQDDFHHENAVLLEKNMRSNHGGKPFLARKNKPIRQKRPDKILLRNFILALEIGAYAHEYDKKQRVCFNVVADVKDNAEHPLTIEDVFSYDILMDGIRKIAHKGHIILVETLAEQIAEFILSYRQIDRVVIRVEKLDLGPEAVGIEIERFSS